MTSASGNVPKRANASHHPFRLPGVATDVGPRAFLRPITSIVPGAAFGSGV